MCRIQDYNFYYKIYFKIGTQSKQSLTLSCALSKHRFSNQVANYGYF